MAGEKNKVLYGLENVYWASVTEGSNGAITYGTPQAWPGAVSLSLDAEGETVKNYADNGVYFVTVSNNGYSGDLEMAIIPEAFMTGILNCTKDTNGAIVEYNDKQPKAFALLFQFKGDVSQRKHVLYNCKMTRPKIEAETTEDSIEMKTQTASIDVSPRASDGAVKAYCEDTSATCYSNWFSSVVEPTVANAGGGGQ